ncbi:MAG: TetR/AcrR family transcriptional regulator [Candidatus Dormibacteraeota bacterium]|uniref:TetR/AcrR family transcriptional regulator n=1 Tax=Candidatus Aeolococcus gillhamiae TaxID=3127015 RepID=A0A934N4R1_9BACT|nr:TetR/AcrR family transcriptional regulator [Candidatus Dormibacteraeota bacterium]
MIAEPTQDRRAKRHEATRTEILEAAWELARSQGLAALTLRDVARRIGTRPPSLYWYFDSKHAIYDAMFADANRQLLARLAEQTWPDDPREAMRTLAHIFVEFSTEDVARYQLMFQRTIPDFEPSPESYALALEVLEMGRQRYHAAGLTKPADFDLGTALIAGLSAQQTANEPGGDRWVRLVDDAVDMYLDHVFSKTAGGRRQP